MKHLIFLYCFCLFSLTSYANETITIVRGDGNYFPFEYQENGKLKGIHIDLIQAVADELELTVKFESLPWARAVFDFKNGKYDAVSHISRTDEREAFAYFLEGNIISSANTYPVVLARRKNEIVFDGNLSSLFGYVIAVGKGYKYGTPFDEAHYLSKYEIPTPSQDVLTKLLRLERVDVIIGSKRNILQVHTEQELNKIYHVYEQPVATNYSYLAFSKVRSNLAIAKKFAAALKKYKASKSYNDLLEAYKNKQHNQNK